MSIRPIDIVTVAPKSQEAAHMQSNNLRGREQTHVNASQVFERNEQRNQQRTVQLSKSDAQAYGFDAKDGNGKGYRKKSGKTKKNEEEKDMNTDVNSFSGGFDIKI